MHGQMVGHMTLCTGQMHHLSAVTRYHSCFDEALTLAQAQNRMVISV
jgi:hypothetical protein